VHTDIDSKVGAPMEKLISVDTPRPSDDFPPVRTSFGSDKENKQKARVSSNLKSPVSDAAELKSVEI
jgi:hypothetical protein